ncbi:MAG: HisA/HisF-related TIM barrel protein [Methanosarcinaceae archaeon]|nr:HisA/HisF-related TIM barrel protein [Methanosarcinaceae archaeon]MDD4497471.1 HisA/HisF-related TIM barrel protein [Methanosarcinaceae archaeon]
MFRVIFVMDLFDRSVVHAKGGNRGEYRPVSESSTVCSSSDPVEIVKGLKPAEVYIADLNVLQGSGPGDTNTDLIRKVSEETSTLLDFGVSGAKDVERALSLATTVVIGTETGTLEGIREAAFEHPGRLCVSLDLKHGKLLKKDPEIPADPFKIVALLNELPLKDLIFLDLDRVGTSTGFDPEFLEKLAKASKHGLLLGGGVKNSKDLLILEKLGLKGALVATAVHSGSIPPAMLREGPGKA